MITIIYGAKGSGKTKQIIEAANSAVTTTKGDVVFVGDEKYSSQINTQVRFFNSHEYGVSGTDMTLGFIKGVLAGNYDITKFYIDGLHRITGKGVTELKAVFDVLDVLSVKDKVDFTVTVSTDVLPDFLRKYM